jgi:hypothetical protein
MTAKTFMETGGVVRGSLRAWVAVAALIGIIVPGTASAVTSISQGYLTTDSLSVGSLVSIDKDSSDHVNATTSENVSNVFGVVIDAGNSLLAVSTGQAGQVQVATSGVAQLLVSDINGEVNSGDSITGSPIKGVGMKATDNIKIIGVAQSGMTSANSSQQAYTDKQGKKHQVRVGLVPVLISVAYYYKQANKTLIPSAVQSLANALAGKQVSPTPILIAAAIFIVTLIVVTSIIYSMIRSSIISVGRNPMSQSAVYRDVVQLSALVLGILTVAFIAIYLVLTKF